MNKKIYDNIKMLAPDGQQLCFIGQQRADWYLKKNLASIVSNNPLIIKLIFEPAARNNIDDLFFLSHKKNMCVVCGNNNLEDLTKHHVVPYCFRKHFSSLHKDKNHYDIVILCEKCHKEYEKICDIKKRKLSTEYNKKVLGDKFEILKRNKINRLASAILKNGDRIPQKRKENIYNELKLFLNKKYITHEDLVSIENMNPDKTRIEWHKEVVDNCNDIDLFIRNWRRHFVETMEPKYMSKHWDVNR